MALVTTSDVDQTTMVERETKPGSTNRRVHTGRTLASEAADMIAGQGSAAMKARIVDAARIEFVRHGYEGASVANVAARASVSKGTVTYCFQSKDALLEAVWEDQLARAEAQSQTDQDAVDVPTQLIYDRLRERDWLRFQLWEGLRCGNAPARIHGLSARIHHWRVRKEQVGRDQRRGLLPAWLDSGQLAFFLYALGTYPHIFPYAAYSTTGHYPNNVSFRAKYRAFVRTLLNVVQNGAGRRGIEQLGTSGA
jgi:AcrR family transcriptional regulator